MSANIFNESFYGTRKAAWHKLGKVFENPLTPTEAVEAVGMDYNIHLKPGMVDVGDGIILPTGKYHIMREPVGSDGWTQLSPHPVSENYSYLQNREIAAALDGITNRYPLSAAGALKNGGTVFFVFKGETFEISEEAVEPYFLFTDTRDGGTSAKMALTPIRVVCQNTLVTGLRAATASVKFMHGSSHRKDVVDYTRLFSEMSSASISIKKAFSAMAKKKVSDDQFKEFLHTIYPVPEEPAAMLTAEFFAASGDKDRVKKQKDLVKGFSASQSRVEAKHDIVAELFGKFNDEFPKTAGTAWAAYNVVAEYEDYRKGKNSENSLLFGARSVTKKRAFAAVS